MGFDGTNNLLVWSDDFGRGELRATRNDRSGAILDPGSFAVCEDGAPYLGTAIASNGSGSLVAWTSEGNKIRVAHVGVDGTVAVPCGVEVTRSPNYDNFVVDVASRARRLLTSGRPRLGSGGSRRRD